MKRNGSPVAAAASSVGASGMLVATSAQVRAKTKRRSRDGLRHARIWTRRCRLLTPRATTHTTLAVARSLKTASAMSDRRPPSKQISTSYLAQLITVLWDTNHISCRAPASRLTPYASMRRSSRSRSRSRRRSTCSVITPRSWSSSAAWRSASITSRRMSPCSSSSCSAASPSS